MTENTWGGSRSGAGPPTLYDKPMIVKTVRLTEEQISALLVLSENLSEAVRLVVDRYIEDREVTECNLTK